MQRRTLPALAALGAAALLATTSVAQQPPLSADAKAVADLDTQYQLAVKKNDAETMSRILLDDFVLVIGTPSSPPSSG